MDADSNPGGPVDWRHPALILATLFLNFFFWFVPANHFWSSGPFSWFVVSVVLVPALVLAVFFLGPALATHRAGQSLFDLAESSFGSWPARAFRCACVTTNLLWIAGLTGVTSFVILSWAHDHELSRAESALPLLLLACFLVATGHQSLSTSAKLALFTNKLGIALLIAGVIRMHAYAELAEPHAPGNWGSEWPNLLNQAAGPLLFVGPMSFLAADFGRRCRTQVDLAKIGVFGLGLPMAGVLLLTGIVQRATLRAHGELGGLANIAVALWGDDAHKFVPPFMAIALITLFGAARFNVRTLVESLGPLCPDRRIQFAFALIAAALAVALATAPGELITRSIEISAGFMASAAAVLSVDFLLRKTSRHEPRRIDWTAVAAFLAGWAASDWAGSWSATSYEFARTASILMPFTASSAVCLLGRTAHKLLRSYARRIA